MPNMLVETGLPKVYWENLHYCHLISIALIIQVQNQEKKHALSKQYALLSQLHLLTRAYSTIYHITISYLL